MRCIFLRLFILFSVVLISLFSFPELLPSMKETREDDPPLGSQSIKTISSDTILGQNLIVGIPGPSLDRSTYFTLSEIKPAGIVLYQRNFRDFQQFTQLIKALQRLAVRTTGFPYYIMLDEEPEGANRTGLLKHVFVSGNPNWKKIREDIHQLARMGINVELAPLADFPFVPNSFISKRIPVSKSEDMRDFNRSFIQMLHQYNIQATLKHFPGLGLLTDDPHYRVVSSNSEISMIEKSMDLFHDGIQNGVGFVMTSHALYEKLDPGNLATFSNKIVQQKLKSALGFNGIVITDDLSDMPLTVNSFELSQSGIMALEAGHHLIMYSHQLNRTKRIFALLLQKANQDPTFYSLLYQNYLKITENKAIHLPIPTDEVPYE